MPVGLSSSWASVFVCAVPEGFRPRDQLRGPVQVDNKANTTAGWWVNRAGNLYVANFGGTPLGSATVSFTACWAAWDN